MFAFMVIKSRYIDVKRLHHLHQSSLKENGEPLTLQHDNHQSHYKMLKELLTMRTWLCLSLGISVLYFIVTGIQFWISNYMEIVLLQPPHLVYIVFSSVSITAPILGCIIGGSLTNYVGGYESDKALYVCLVFCLMSCFVGIPVAFIDTFWLVSALIWLLLFFGGALVPPLTGGLLVLVRGGIIKLKYTIFSRYNDFLSSIKIKSICQFQCDYTLQFIWIFTSTQCIWFNDKVNKYGDLIKLRIDERAGVQLLMFYPCVGLIFLIMAIIFKNQEKQKKLLENQRIQALEQQQYQNKMSETNKNLPVSHSRINQVDNETLEERIFDFHELPMNVTITQQFQKEDFYKLFQQEEQKIEETSEF